VAAPPGKGERLADNRHIGDDRLGFADMDFFKEGMNINIGIIFGADFRV
jgi:hypothetical protein